MAHKDNKPGIIIGGPELFELEMQIAREKILASDRIPQKIPRKTTLLEKSLQGILHFGTACAFEHPDEIYFNQERLESLNILKIQDPSINSLPIRPSDNPSEEEKNAAIEDIQHWGPLASRYVYHWLDKMVPKELLSLYGFAPASLANISKNHKKQISHYAPEIALRFCFQNEDDFLDSLDNQNIPGFVRDIILYGSLVNHKFVPFLLLAANQAKLLITESNQSQLPLLSNIIQPSFYRKKSVLNASSCMDLFKAAIAQEGYQMPRVGTVSNLISLLKDDRVLSLQSFITEFRTALNEGNFEKLPNLRNKIKKSTTKLSRLSKGKIFMRWSFLLPISTGIAEAFAYTLPIASTLSALGLEYLHTKMIKSELRHKWVSLLSPYESSAMINTNYEVINRQYQL